MKQTTSEYNVFLKNKGTCAIKTKLVVGVVVPTAQFIFPAK
jgi:hypothetical protein